MCLNIILNALFGGGGTNHNFDDTKNIETGEIKDPDCSHDSDIGREPGHGGFFVPPLWMAKIITKARRR